MQEMHELVIRNACWLRQKASVFTRNEDKADDLASETIYRCLKYASRYNNEYDFRNWAIRIMANVHKTEGKKRKESIAGELSLALLIDPDDPSSKVAVRILIKTMKELVPKHVGMRPLLMRIANKSYEEIAQSLSIPVGTVKSRINSARKFLANLL